MESDLYQVYFTDNNYGWAIGYGVGGDYIICTTDGGTNWIFATFVPNTNINSVIFIDHNIGWVVGVNGYIGYTTNGGNNFNYQTSGTTAELKSVYFIDNNNNGWVVGEYGTVLHTTDGGANWYFQGSSTTKSLLSVFFVEDNIGWAVGDEGTIIAKTGSGVPWASQSSGTANDLCSVCFVDKYIGWAVGDSGTILKTTDGGVTFIEGEIVSPIEFLLEQNYPNPFNPSTTIKYRIPELSFVTLKVYDVLGNEITTLVNEEKSIGSYEVKFDAAALPSGVYFYRLQAGSFVETKKMILLR